MLENGSEAPRTAVMPPAQADVMSTRCPGFKLLVVLRHADVGDGDAGRPVLDALGHAQSVTLRPICYK
jgi:hypothetical protein